MDLPRTQNSKNFCRREGHKILLKWAGFQPCRGFLLPRCVGFTCAGTFPVQTFGLTEEGEKKKKHGTHLGEPVSPHLTKLMENVI